MASSVRRRTLDDVLRALGSDQTGDQPTIDRTSALLGYDIGQLQYSLPNRTSQKLWMHVIPSTLAAQFSSIDLTPFRGMWVRTLCGFGANMLVNVFYSPGQPAFAVNDSLGAISVCLSNPEGSDYPVSPAGLNGYALSDVVVGSNLGAPQLFAFAQVGRLAAARSGMFLPANQPQSLLDMWIPAFATLEISCGAANTAISVQLQLEFPAETVFFP